MRMPRSDARRKSLLRRSMKRLRRSRNWRPNRLRTSGHKRMLEGKKRQSCCDKSWQKKKLKPRRKNG